METRRLLLIAFVIIAINAFKTVFSDCPAQTWNLRCNACCEPGWLACTCPATGENTGYAVPCCRRGRTCPPCLDYPGCDVFANCRTCYTSEAGLFQHFSDGRKYCSNCNIGWKGGDCKTCGGILREIRGTIEIVNYPDSIECLWTIDVEITSLIDLRFERFDLETDPRCVYDKLTIYDGGYSPHAKAKTLCGNKIPKRFISQTHVIVLKFESDESNTLSGFRAIYRSLNACARTPCKYGGACVLTQASSFVCVCRKGFSGDLCEIVSRCRLAKIPPNLIYELDESRNNFGAKITYTCEKGYHQQGAALAVCLESGRWSQPPPTCVPACKDLAPPMHGHIDGGLALIGSTVIYTCDAGYQLVGPRKRTCTKERTWSGETPICVFEDGCLDPATPSFGFRTLSIGNSSSTDDELQELVNNGMFPYFSSIIYECEEQYALKGNYIRTCLPNGSFSGYPAECVAEDIEVSCSPLEPGPGQVISTYFDGKPTKIDIDFTNTHQVGTVAKINCAPDVPVTHKLATTVCLPNGTWSEPAIKIRCYNGTKCSPLPRLKGGLTHIHLPSEGSFNHTNLIHGYSDIPVDTTVTFSCINSEAFVLAGSSLRVCREDGTWSGTRPYCVKGCQDPGIPPHMLRDEWIGPESQPRQKDRSQFLLLERLLPYGYLPPETVLQFECASTDFFLKGLEKRRCISNGTWTGQNNPVCLPRCGVNPRPIIHPDQKDVLPSLFPWHALIKKKNRVLGNWQVHCSGAYIGHNLILTAAQCVTFSSTTLPYQPSDLSIELGSSNERGLTYQYDVAEIVINSDFDPILHDYDIALLVLHTGVVIPDDKSVWPVCISTDTELLAPRARMLFINETGTVSAWTENHTVKSRNETRIFKRNVNSLDVPHEQVNENIKVGPSTFDKEIDNEFDYFAEGSGDDNWFDNNNKMSAATYNVNETTKQINLNINATTLHTLNKIVESLQITRIFPSFCERAFGRRMQRSRMICGNQNNEEQTMKVIATAMRKKCFAVKGNPLVVMRNVKYKRKRKKKKDKRKRNTSSRRRWKRQTDPSFNPFLIGGQTIDNAVPLTSFQSVSIVRKIVKTSSSDKTTSKVVIVPTEPPQVTIPTADNKKTTQENRKKKRKKKRFPNKAWMLEGVTSWTIVDNCRSENPLPFYVFTKIKYFTPWVKRKRDEITLKKLLLPSL